MTSENSTVSQLCLESIVEGIQAAHIQLSGHVVRTPVIRLPWLDTSEREVWAKLDCYQHSGSFKYRGTFNALMNTSYTSIITASAGNHAFATALSGKRLGKDVFVIAPTTTSEVKVNRLKTDAEVTLLGRNLCEATKIAMERADNSSKEIETGVLYLSPYADFHVATGAGTVIVEAMEDAGDFDVVILPLGGGGLAAAVGSWCSLKSPSTQVVCTHPEVFGRTFSAAGFSISKELCQPTVATYADSLDVQLLEQTPFAEILDHTISSVIPVSESAIAVAIGSALRLQSLLIEGAAATTIAALISGTRISQQCRGRVLLLLTGGNVSSATIAKALVSEVSDPRLREQLGLRNAVPAVRRHGSMHMSHPSSNSNNQVLPSLYTVWQTLVERLGKSIWELKEMFDRKQTLAQQSELQNDAWSISIFTDLHRKIVDLHTQFTTDLATPDCALPYWVMDERYRILLQLQSVAASLLERASAAYDQAKRDWYFDITAQGTAALNYARNGSVDLRHLECKILDALGLSVHNQPIELLLTSSGMASYQLIEHYLIRHLSPNETIVLPPYIYFEAMEQLETLNHIRLKVSKSFSAEDIIATAEKYNAKAVFIDPIANVVGLPTTDILLFAQLICSRPEWAERTVIIDGTLASGALSIYDWFKGPNSPTVIYHESASKYPQLGLDLQMAGILAYPTMLDNTMRKARHGTGAIMYPRNANLFPPLDFSIYQTRMSALTKNAETFYCHLKDLVSSVAEVCFPVDWAHLHWRHGGALVTIRFRSEGFNNKEGLDVCMSLILRQAEKLNVPLVKGVSFGFSTSRICAASSMAKHVDPFLRLSIGVAEDEVQPLATAVAFGVEQYHSYFSVTKL